MLEIIKNKIKNEKAKKKRKEKEKRKEKKKKQNSKIKTERRKKEPAEDQHLLLHPIKFQQVVHVPFWLKKKEETHSFLKEVKIISLKEKRREERKEEEGKNMIEGSIEIKFLFYHL